MSQSCPDHPEEHRPDPQAILISGCGCAIISLTPSGAAVYDMQKLITHFHEHDNMKELDDEDEEYSTAIDWIQYNVIRGLDYMLGSITPLMLPVIMDDEYQVYPFEDEDDDNE